MKHPYHMTREGRVAGKNQKEGAERGLGACSCIVGVGRLIASYPHVSRRCSFTNAFTSCILSNLRTTL